MAVFSLPRFPNRASPASSGEQMMMVLIIPSWMLHEGLPIELQSGGYNLDGDSLLEYGDRIKTQAFMELVVSTKPWLPSDSVSSFIGKIDWTTPIRLSHFRSTS